MKKISISGTYSLQYFKKVTYVLLFCTIVTFDIHAQFFQPDATYSQGVIYQNTNSAYNTIGIGTVTPQFNLTVFTSQTLQDAHNFLTNNANGGILIINQEKISDDISDG